MAYEYLNDYNVCGLNFPTPTVPKKKIRLISLLSKKKITLIPDYETLIKYYDISSFKRKYAYVINFNICTKAVVDP